MLFLALKHYGIWREQKTTIFFICLFVFLLRNFFCIKIVTLEIIDIIMMYCGEMADPKLVICNSFCALLINLNNAKINDHLAPKRELTLYDYHKCTFYSNCAANVRNNTECAFLCMWVFFVFCFFNTIITIKNVGWFCLFVVTLAATPLTNCKSLLDANDYYANDW